MTTTCEDDREARYYGRTSYNSKCAGMNGGTSRGASGEVVVRRVNENDLFDATGMNPNFICVGCSTKPHTG